MIIISISNYCIYLGKQHRMTLMHSIPNICYGIPPVDSDICFVKVEVNKRLALDKVALWDAQEKLRSLSMEELEARKVAKGDYKKWALMEEIS